MRQQASKHSVDQECVLCTGAKDLGASVQHVGNQEAGRSCWQLWGAGEHDGRAAAPVQPPRLRHQSHDHAEKGVCDSAQLKRRTTFSIPCSKSSSMITASTALHPACGVTYQLLQYLRHSRARTWVAKDCSAAPWAVLIKQCSSCGQDTPSHGITAHRQSSRALKNTCKA